MPSMLSKNARFFVNVKSEHLQLDATGYLILLNTTQNVTQSMSDAGFVFPQYIGK